MKVILRNILPLTLAILSSCTAIPHILPPILISPTKKPDPYPLLSKGHGNMDSPTVAFIDPYRLLPEGHEEMDSPTARFIKQCPDLITDRFNDWTKYSDHKYWGSYYTVNDNQKAALVRASHEIIEKEDKISKEGRFSLGSVHQII